MIWHAYECLAECGGRGSGVVLDLRIDNAEAPSVFCPMCGRRMKHGASWAADANGYGSRASSPKVERVKCDRCDGTGELGTEYVPAWPWTEQLAWSGFPILRAGCVEAWIETPPSAAIAYLLNGIVTFLGAADHSRTSTCVHGNNPCISRCGVRHTPDGWEVIPHEERVEWYAHVYTFNPQRRNQERQP